MEDKKLNDLLKKHGDQEQLEKDIKKAVEKENKIQFSIKDLQKKSKVIK